MLIIGAMPLPFGGVQHLVWAIYAGIFISFFLFELWFNPSPLIVVRSKSFMVIVAFFYGYTLLQTIPLPESVLAYLSPLQYNVRMHASQVLDKGFLPHAMAYRPMFSLSYWIFLLGIWLFFFVLRRYLMENKQLMAIVGTMMAIGMIEALYGLLQALIPSLGVLWVDKKQAYIGVARGTFINRNHFAGFLEMVWPMGLGFVFALAHDWRETVYTESFRNKLNNWLSSDHFGFLLFWGSALLFMLLALMFSQSRAGIAGAFIGIASFIGLAHMGGKKLSPATWIWFGCGLMFLLFYGNRIGFEHLIDRFLAMDDGAGSRFDIWMDTLAINKEHPLGIGLKNYAIVFPLYHASGRPGIIFTHAHNDYLQLLTEAGWPGFFALTSVFFMFLADSFRHIPKLYFKTDAKRFYLGIGAFSGLISILFHSFFDFNLQIPANLLYFITLIGIAQACIHDRSSQPYLKRH